MSTLRGWWEEDRAVSGRFYHHFLENQETHRIIANLPFVWKSLKGTCKTRLCYVYFWQVGCRYQENYAGKIHTGTLNIPAIVPHYWRYRMHITLEALLKQEAFNASLKDKIKAAGR